MKKEGWSDGRYPDTSHRRIVLFDVWCVMCAVPGFDSRKYLPGIKLECFPPPCPSLRTSRLRRTTFGWRRRALVYIAYKAHHTNLIDLGCCNQLLNRARYPICIVMAVDGRPAWKIPIYWDAPRPSGSIRWIKQYYGHTHKPLMHLRRMGPYNYQTTINTCLNIVTCTEW